MHNKHKPLAQVQLYILPKLLPKLLVNLKVGPGPCVSLQKKKISVQHTEYENRKAHLKNNGKRKK
jgi:hypothetical protein